MSRSSLVNSPIRNISFFSGIRHCKKWKEQVNNFLCLRISIYVDFFCRLCNKIEKRSYLFGKFSLRILWCRDTHSCSSRIAVHKFHCSGKANGCMETENENIKLRPSNIMRCNSRNCCTLERTHLWCERIYPSKWEMHTRAAIGFQARSTSKRRRGRPHRAILSCCWWLWIP